MTRYTRLGIMLLMCCGYGAIAPAADAGNSAGHAVFMAWCAGCHADSPLAPATVALRAMRGAENAVLEQRKDLSPALIRTLVRRGYAGMPSFRRTEIGDQDLDALVAYLSSADTAEVEE